MPRRLRMYRDIVRILLQRIRIWLTSIRNDRRMNLFNFSQFLSFKFPNARCYIFVFPASSLRFCKLFDSLILVFAISIFNFVTSQILIYKFRLSTFPVLTFDVASSKRPISNFSNFHRNKSLACKQITTGR